ncbi:uncharacterized protein LOC131666348 isoform X2 [Phymastichus coffea]|nr:uncharacterized protein LOC131666348 isoform X2 [Phymastichus coffea]
MMWYKNEGRKNKYQTIYIDDILFRVGNDLIVLTEGAYEKDPHVDISSNFGGRLTTLAVIARFLVKDGKLKGKMRIYSTSKSPIETTYELFLNNAELIQTIGLKICGDGWDFDNCKYKFVKNDLSFKYFDNSKEISVFTKESDIHKRKLLEQSMLEYITKELGPALENYMVTQLSIKCLVSNSVGADYSLKNVLSIHNKKLRKALKNLSEKIICITNSLLVKKSPKLKYSEFFCLIEKNNEMSLKVCSGWIDQFDSLSFFQDKDVIVSNEEDLVIVHVPVDFGNLKLHITELSSDSPVNNKEQTYKTSNSYFIMSLKRLSENKAKINLVSFKVLDITPKSKTLVIVAMDHLIKYAIEQHMKPFLEEAMTYNELQELAIKPDVEIEYDYDNDLMAEDSESE